MNSASPKSKRKCLESESDVFDKSHEAQDFCLQRSTVCENGIAIV